MIRSWPDDKKRNSVERDESWMKVPDRKRNEERCAFNSRDGLVPYRSQAPYQAPRNLGYRHPKSSLLLIGHADFLRASEASPLGNSVLANASSDLTKLFNLAIISSTVFGTLSEYRLANSGHLVSLAFLTILFIFIGSLKHALLVENVVMNCYLSFTHPSMLPPERFLNHSLALPSRVCWNIQHHTGIGHSPKFVAEENRLRWSSGSVVPSYSFIFAGILNSGQANSIILRVSGVFMASLKGLFRWTSPISFPVTTVRYLVRSSTLSKLMRIGDTFPRPLYPFTIDLRANIYPSLGSFAEGVVSDEILGTQFRESRRTSSLCVVPAYLPEALPENLSEKSFGDPFGYLRRQMRQDPVKPGIRKRVWPFRKACRNPSGEIHPVPVSGTSVVK
nr:hypothetical protein [Tanacetum cinerariifolium]